MNELTIKVDGKLEYSEIGMSENMFSISIGPSVVIRAGWFGRQQKFNISIEKDGETLITKSFKNFDTVETAVKLATSVLTNDLIRGRDTCFENLALDLDLYVVFD